MKVSLDRYIVTPDGQIFDKQRNNQPVRQFASKEYLSCCIYDKYGKHKIDIHRIIAKSYCHDWFDGCVVHHIDGNKHNNNASNLKCMTKAEHAKLHMSTIADKIMICPCCKNEFIWTASAQRNHAKRKFAKCSEPFCSKSCVAKYLNHSKKHKTKIKCIETNMIFESCADASRAMNICKTMINDVVRGIHKSTHGFHFERVQT